MDINKHMIQGGIVLEPKINGEGSDRWAQVRVATTRRWKKSDGWGEKKTYHNVVVRGFLVEKLVGAVVGDVLTVCGYAEDFKFTDNDGKPQQIRQLIAEELSVPMRPTQRRDEGKDDSQRSQQPSPSPHQNQSAGAPQQQRNNGATAGQPAASQQPHRQDVRQQPQQRAPSPSNGGGNEQLHPYHPDFKEDRGSPADDLPPSGDEFSNMEHEIAMSGGTQYGYPN